MAKILIIEDDLVISESVSTWLKKENHQVETTASGKEGLELSLHYSYDLLILDWNLPDAMGPDIARAIRAKQIDIPILMFTTNSMVQQKVEGLDAGACDYVPKPCAMEEIAARIRALLRRLPEKREENLRFENVEIENQSHTVKVGEHKLKFSPTEFEILAFLIANSGESFSSEALIARLWTDRAHGSKKSVQVHIRHIREKLIAAGSRAVIVTSDLGEYSVVAKNS